MAKFHYDDAGRQTKVTDPASRVTYTVYLDNETRTYPVWDDTTNELLQPIQTLTDGV